MKTFKLFLILGILFAIINQSCEGTKCRHDYKVTIVNNDIKRVYYHIYWNYPDTSIGEYNPIHNGTDGLSTGESFVIGSTLGFCWENWLDSGKKQFVYFFDADSLALIPWDTIRKTQRGLLERREINLVYLNQHNFIVTYP